MEGPLPLGQASQMHCHISARPTGALTNIRPCVTVPPSVVYKHKQPPPVFLNPAGQTASYDSVPRNIDEIGSSDITFVRVKSGGADEPGVPAGPGGPGGPGGPLAPARQGLPLVFGGSLYFILFFDTCSCESV